jgi:hypothetical protein
MSKLKDALRKSGESDGGRALGFAPSSTAKHRSLLVGIHTGAEAGGAKAGLRAGADFAVMHTDDATSAAASIAAADAGPAFFGSHVAKLAEGDGEKLVESGCAFVVVDPERGSAAEAAHEDLGVVIPVDLSAEHRDLQTLSRLDLEAVVVPEEIAGISLSLHASLLRASALTGRRVLVKVAASIAESELKVLRDSGVGALLVPDSASAKAVKGLIDRIESLEPRKPADEGGRHISLGQQSASAS